MDRVALCVCMLVLHATIVSMLYSITEAVALGGDFFGHAHLIPTWSVKYVCDGGMCFLQPDSLQKGCPHAGIVCDRKLMM